MTKSDYSEALQVLGVNVNDLFRLPCVRTVCKTDDGGWQVLVLTDDGRVLPAGVGDWICRHRETGGWHVLTPLEFECLE